jgi:hypothetical protein
MEAKWLECGIASEGLDKRFNHESNNCSQSKVAVFVDPFCFQHLSKVSRHSLGLGHVEKVSCDGQFDTASEWFYQITGKTWSIFTELVDDSYVWLQPASDTLPLDGMVKEAIAIIECHIQGVCWFLFFAKKKVLAQTFKIA